MFRVSLECDARRSGSGTNSKTPTRAFCVGQSSSGSRAMIASVFG
jgi:hypothetical protein